MTSILVSIPIFVVSLHSPNGRHLPAVMAVQVDCPWHLQTSGNSHRPHDPIVHCDTRQSQHIFKPTDHIYIRLDGFLSETYHSRLCTSIYMIVSQCISNNKELWGGPILRQSLIFQNEFLTSVTWVPAVQLGTVWPAPSVSATWNRNYQVCPALTGIYRKISNISRTKSKNSNDSRLVLHLSLPNLLKPGVK